MCVVVETENVYGFSETLLDTPFLIIAHYDIMTITIFYGAIYGCNNTQRGDQSLTSSMCCSVGFSVLLLAGPIVLVHVSAL